MSPYLIIKNTFLIQFEGHALQHETTGGACWSNTHVGLQAQYDIASKLFTLPVSGVYLWTELSVSEK